MENEMLQSLLSKREEYIRRRNEIPWRERMRSFNIIRRFYVDKGVPVEQFLEDYPDKVEKYNITIDDLMYVEKQVREYEAGL